MKLFVKNFGAIKDLEIDLSKKIYLFVGYNNTGKTYLSYLLYSIFDKEILNDFSTSPYNTLSQDFNNRDSIKLDRNFVKPLLENFGKHLSDIVIPNTLKVNKNHFIVKNLSIEFDYNEEELELPSLNTSGGIGIRSREDTLNRIDIFSLNKPENSLEAQIIYKSNEDIYKDLPNDFFDNIPKNKFERDIGSVKKDVSKSLAHAILNLLIQNKEQPFLLPANRIFLLENADELLAQDYDRKKEMAELFMEAIENKNLDSKVLRDLIAKKAKSNYIVPIEKLIGLVSELRREKDNDLVEKGTMFYDDLLEKMASVMGGKVVMYKFGEMSNWVEQFKMKNFDTPIHFYLASSSVNQLGLLFQYLKYWAKNQENFLMIDEPEINLHPENQIALVNLLLEFACVNNNRLLLTTHSPLVAEIMNNYLILDKVKSKGLEINEEIEQNPYFNPNLKITNEDVAIYAFGKNGEIVPYNFERYSVFFKTFNKEINKISAIQSSLTDQIFYSQENEN